MSDQITPFRIEIGDDPKPHLKRRLRATRWPERECVDDWTQDCPWAMRRKSRRTGWRSIDWRKCEARLNHFPQYKPSIIRPRDSILSTSARRIPTRRR